MKSPWTSSLTVLGAAGITLDSESLCFFKSLKRRCEPLNKYFGDCVPMQVLSNPDRRQVYDIYGKEGLSAGLEVGSTLKSTDELRQEWESFKAQQVPPGLHACSLEMFLPS